MAAPDSIKKLVEEFERLKGGPTPDSFDEAQLCTSFIEPFWKALGWNVRDPREVVKEKRVHLRASTKHADYCFQLKGKPQFVIEAKDYRKNLDDADFIFQTKRYGYNLPVDFGVLTNFAEFRLYDTGLQPVYENRGRGLFKPYLLQYTEYEEKWDELAAVFSREAVAAGVLRELLPKARRTRNKEALDRTFFEGLNEWRAELARVIALRNPDVGVHDINEAVQRILDRCIFMRVIEDREIEAVELLLDALNRWSREKEKPLYRYIVDKFRYLEPQYNGELFEPHFSEDLLVDDKPLKDFIASLYYPECPYQFNVVGVEMLGTIYERFLGSTIRLTKSHRAVVEEKPEVRKAGGVYYTPKYIVDYIVENTVGDLLAKCKTPAAAAKLKILDPACGSGSFLLGAFQRLIDWHEEYFNANPDKISKGPAAECWWDAEAGKHRLNAKYKGQVLVNNIYGVDIDDQACEVTRMSLYLKVLENVNAQYLIKTALLPQLDANIKCGNSLIGSDYFEGQLMPSEVERRRVNPFDWEVEFGDIFDSGLKGGLDSGLKPTVSGTAGGGFDAVIGNPPWVSSISVSTDKKYLVRKYATFTTTADLYICFIERSLSVLKSQGIFGFIVSSKWMRAAYGGPIREFLSSYRINQIIDFGSLKIFEHVTTYASIIIIEKDKPLKEVFVVTPEELETGAFDVYVEKTGYKVDSGCLNERGFEIARPAEKALKEKILDAGQNLKAYVENEIYYGIKTAFNKGYIIDPEKKEYFAKKDPASEEIIMPFLMGKDIKRYGYLTPNQYVLLVRIGTPIKNFPLVFEHLSKYKENLKKRTDQGDFWWELRPCDYYGKFKAPKILWPGISKEVTAFAFDSSGFYGNDNIQMIITDDLYLLGILNSLLIKFYLQGVCDKVQGGFYRLKMIYIETIPIKTIDKDDPADVARHDKMVALVEEMLELHKRLAAAKSDADKQRLQRAIAATDREIDTLVYELYGLTDEEIKIVEGG